MMTISLCMIVKNEENTIARCLSSVYDLVDEIIIVDTGSTDNTKKIVKMFTDKVYDYEWVNDFSEARNYAFSLATMDYQMWLDADDIITEDEAAKFMQLKESLSDDVDVVTMKYHTHLDEYGNPVFTSTRERLLKRAADFLWYDPVHEYIPMRGNIVNSDVAITHKKDYTHAQQSDRNIKIYEERLNRGEVFNPRSTYYYARELMDHERYEEAVEYFEKFIDDGKGWREDNITACLCLARCYDKLGKASDRLHILFCSFMYDLPRAEVCCEIAYDYRRNNDYERAIFWYNLALDIPQNNNGGFVQNDYYGFIPHIELCVCYSHLQRYDIAKYHNDMAGQLKPDAHAVKHNEEFFRSLEVENN